MPLTKKLWNKFARNKMCVFHLTSHDFMSEVQRVHTSTFIKRDTLGQTNHPPINHKRLLDSRALYPDSLNEASTQPFQSATVWESTHFADKDPSFQCVHSRLPTFPSMKVNVGRRGIKPAVGSHRKKSHAWAGTKRCGVGGRCGWGSMIKVEAYKAPRILNTDYTWLEWITCIA